MRALVPSAVLVVLTLAGCGKSGEITGTQEKALESKLSGPPNALHRHGGADRAQQAPGTGSDRK